MEKIRLRALEPEDVELMFGIENYSDDWKHGDIVAPYSKRQLLEYAMNYDADPMNAGQLRLVVVNEADEAVGLVDLYDISEKNRNAFIGISILPSYRKRGYGHHAVNAITRYALSTLGLHSVGAKVLASNEKAIGLFGKCGFIEMGTLKEWHRTPEGFEDVKVMQYQTF